MSPKLRYNLLALLTTVIWGLTFVSTKILISNGLTPTCIFIIRFAVAYLCILAISHKRLWANNFKDELYMAAMGLTGGSLYFILENTALQYTFASNVSLIICATPILTLFLCAISTKQRIHMTAVIGAVLALLGVSIVVLNSSMNLGLNPIGDLLTLLAALSWAFYCLLLKKMNGRYSNLFITRKVFFYGFASALIICLFQPLPILPERDTLLIVTYNLGFLSLVASFVCYLIWNKSVKIIGPEWAANYIYFTPLVTIVASSLILRESITLWLVFGAVVIIVGVFLSSFYTNRQ